MDRGIFQPTIEHSHQEEILAAIGDRQHPICGDRLHVTLLFNTTQEEFPVLRRKLGDRFEIELFEHRCNDRVEAIAVELPKTLEVFCQNATPHITISWINNASPVESNAMLQSCSAQQLNINREVVYGYLEFVPFKVVEGDRP